MSEQQLQDQPASEPAAAGAEEVKVHADETASAASVPLSASAASTIVGDAVAAASSVAEEKKEVKAWPVDDRADIKESKTATITIGPVIGKVTQVGP